MGETPAGGACLAHDAAGYMRACGRPGLFWFDFVGGRTVCSRSCGRWQPILERIGVRQRDMLRRVFRQELVYESNGLIPHGFKLIVVCTVGMTGAKRLRLLITDAKEWSAAWVTANQTTIGTFS